MTPVNPSPGIHVSLVDSLEASLGIGGARPRKILKGFWGGTIRGLEEGFEDERQGIIIDPLMDIDGDLFWQEAFETPPISNGVRQTIRRKVSRQSHSWL